MDPPKLLLMEMIGFARCYDCWISDRDITNQLMDKVVGINGLCKSFCAAITSISIASLIHSNVTVNR